MKSKAKGKPQRDIILINVESKGQFYGTSSLVAALSDTSWDGGKMLPAQARTAVAQKQPWPCFYAPFLSTAPTGGKKNPGLRRALCPKLEAL